MANPFTKYRAKTDNWHTLWLRTRHGARAACARLRRERNEARFGVQVALRHIDRLQRGSRLVSDYITERELKLQNERDTAREELRVRNYVDQWLRENYARSLCIGIDGEVCLTVQVGDGDEEIKIKKPTYAAAARALGMPEETKP